MYCYSCLLLAIFVSLQLFGVTNAACKATTTTTTPPPPPCSLCSTLPFMPPPQGYNTMPSNGIVRQAVDSNGCKQYAVTCYAYGSKYIVVGANQQFIQLSQAWPGQKSATLLCNSQGQIEGKNYVTGAPLIVTSVYCARQV